MVPDVPLTKSFLSFFLCVVQEAARGLQTD